MTRIEERLREDLPALADALIAAPSSTPARDAPEPGTGPIALEAARNRRSWSTRLAVAAAAAAVVVVAGIAMGAGRDSDTALDTSDRTAAPTSFGVWRPLPEAPISTRSYPVSVWTGTEALFWGGSSLDRSFAYTEAVAYDPNAGSWRDVVEPGWGHPGAKGVAVNGELFVLAKGSGARFDFETEEWTSLPPVEGMFFTAVVASEDTIWGLGPVLDDLEGQPDLAIVRYDPDADRWIPGPTFEGTAETAGIIDAARDIDRPAVWTGDAIVVWDAQRGLAFDPDEQAWTLLPRLVPPAGDIVTSREVPGTDGLIVVAELELDGQRTTGVARLDAGRWSWRATDLPPVDLGSATAAGAGSWVVLLPADDPPVTVHLPSGAWHEHGDAPLQGVQGPGTVWTGSQLIVWGGAHHVSSSADPATGMAWTPPPVNTSEVDADGRSGAETDRERLTELDAQLKAEIEAEQRRLAERQMTELDAQQKAKIEAEQRRLDERQNQGE